jgi:hypothetical protein
MRKNIKDVIDSIPAGSPGTSPSPDYLSDQKYAQNCEEIISNALSKGYDVVQLENGDIITTGTKLVVTKYGWDPARKKMQKIASRKS